MSKAILDQLIPREEAVRMLLDAWNPESRTEIIPLEAALGRVAADDIHSRNTLPVCRASMGDGIAVKLSDFKKGMPDTEHWVKGKDYVQADTGDDFPDEFDGVIMIEEVIFNADGGLTLSKGVRQEEWKQNIRKKGAAMKAGELLLRKRTKIRENHLASLAAGGITEFAVYEKPKVAFIPTGNELVPRGVRPERGENVEANGIMVRAILENAGAEVSCHEIVRDDKKLLKLALENALKDNDIVVICAGTAKGKEDYTHTVLSECGTVLQHGILTAPGRPVAFAISGSKPVINIPGPTLGACYAAEFCVVPLINRMLYQPGRVRETVSVVLEEDITVVDFMEVIIRLEVTLRNGAYYGKPIPMSASLAAAIRDCNALVRVPVGIGAYQKGQHVEAELLYGKEGIL